MNRSGLRSVLQPSLVFGITLAIHALLLFFGPVRFLHSPPTTVRGVKVKALAIPRQPPVVPIPPQVSRPTPADSPSRNPDTASGPSSSPVSSPPSADSPVTSSEYERYLARLRSGGVQGWARDSARESRKSWTAKDKKEGRWVPAEGGEGTGKGKGGTSYLDPRVQVVVTSYPPTEIEKRHGFVAYPDQKFKKHQYASGWWNVWIQIKTDSHGNVIQNKVLRPDGDGPLQRIFVAAVQEEIGRWSFDPVAAEINVDVRFYVE